MSNFKSKCCLLWMSNLKSKCYLLSVQASGKVSAYMKLSCMCSFALRRGKSTGSPITCPRCDGLVLQLVKWTYLVLQLASNVQLWSWANHRAPTGLLGPEPVSTHIFATYPCLSLECTRSTGICIDRYAPTDMASTNAGVHILLSHADGLKEENSLDVHICMQGERVLNQGKEFASKTDQTQFGKEFTNFWKECWDNFNSRYNTINY